MKFQYEAKTPQGAVKKGEMEAKAPSEVVKYLSKYNLAPVHIALAKEKSHFLKMALGETLSADDKIFFARYLSLMVQLGVDLINAIDILREDAEKSITKDFLWELRKTIESGDPIYTAFQKYNKSFSNAEINLVKAGEESGNLEKIFSDLAANWERNKDFQKKLKSAMIYPVMLIAAAAGIIFLLGGLVIPKIAKVLIDADLKLPLYSRIVIGFGLFINKFLWPLLIIFFVFGVGLFIFIRNKKGKEIIMGFLSKLPYLKTLILAISIQRFCDLLSSLLKGGMTINKSLEITASSISEPRIKLSLLRISKNLTQGLTIGAAFKREPVYPSVVKNLIAMGERGGKLQQVLADLAGFYEKEITNRLSALIAIIEPAILVIIGIVVGVMAVSVILPIYSLVTQF